MMNEHDLHCKAIAEDLRKYNDGCYISYNGDTYEIDDLETVEIDGYEYYVIDGENVDPDETETLSLYDYFDDYYNIDWILDSNKELQAVRVMVACGGPNIYINTWDKQVELFWWTDSGKYYLDNDLCNAINSIFEEYWNM